MPWSEIPQPANVSGAGRNTTAVELGDGSAGHNGAYLDLGEFVDTARIVVNGQPLPPVDLMNPVVDIGSVLRPGSNVIEVELASTLLNRLEWPVLMCSAAPLGSGTATWGRFGWSPTPTRWCDVPIEPFQSATVKAD